MQHFPFTFRGAFKNGAMSKQKLHRTCAWFVYARHLYFRVIVCRENYQPFFVVCCRTATGMFALAFDRLYCWTHMPQDPCFDNVMRRHGYLRRMSGFCEWRRSGLSFCKGLFSKIKWTFGFLWKGALNHPFFFHKKIFIEAPTLKFCDKL